VTCNHCPRVATHPRGLCKLCYQNPAIRQQYPAMPRAKEKTLAELNAEIDEHLKPENLPKWWFTGPGGNMRKGQNNVD